MERSTSDRTAPAKDPRTIARKYQLDLCKRAVEENIIVYLGTGCGKTHIAVLLMYELGHLIRKPKEDICVFLAPSVPLVRQQAIVIADSTDFKVQCYYGNRKQLKNHDKWENEIKQTEVLVMTPQMLLHNLRHCFIRMEQVALLIFDECHHAQAQKRHPYAQIMKEFYKTNTKRSPRIFGMTASPIIGKGGSNQSIYTKCLNTLENLLDAKVCSVENNVELESIVASPDVKMYFHGPKLVSASSFNVTYCKKLEEIKSRCMSMVREKTADLKDLQKKMKLLWRVHDNLIFCLENIGLWGAIQATRILLTNDGLDLSELEIDRNCKDNCILVLYLNLAASALKHDFMNGEKGCYSLEALEEPFFSKKLSLLIEILYKYREKANIKCIVFVKRIVVARSLAYILGNLKGLEFWKCEFLVGFHSGSVSRTRMNAIVEKFCTGEVNLLVATNVAEEGLDIQTCGLVVRFDLPETVSSFIQSRGRARMLKSEYVFLVERGNQNEERLLNDFMADEDIMNKEITCRTSSDTFVDLEEATYIVDATGASVSTGCSVSLLYHYCSKLPHDEYFIPMPEFFYKDDLNGTICTIILPSNAPLRHVESQALASKDEAKRDACLKACMELHARGALTDYLLPRLRDEKKNQSETEHAECDSNEDETLREELHEMLVPAAIRAAPENFEDCTTLHFYYIKFIPIPEDREYRKFGVFFIAPLPQEAETMEVDLHLAHGRIVKAGLRPSGMIPFDKEEIVLAEKFQAMFLKIILDRSEFFSNFITLGECDFTSQGLSTFYLLLPVMQCGCGENMIVDWSNVRDCLSSPVFKHPTDTFDGGHPPGRSSENLILADGPVDKRNIVKSLVFTSSNRSFFFIDDILYETNAYSKTRCANSMTYAESYKNRFNIELLNPEQPLLKAKPLFFARNLLHNRLQETTEARELEEHVVKLPPEVCSLKIIGFSKDIGSSLSLLPSFMHRLECFLVAIQLKAIFAASFPEGVEITAPRVLEALTTEKCLERFSLERLEVLGDAFLKYAVGRHSFLSYDAVDEGRLTEKRSSIVNNLHLYELAIKKKLQVYICDELFVPSQFFALGRPCKRVCNKERELTIHCRVSNGTGDGAETSILKCSKFHRWLHRKTIADAVEALIGAFLVDSGFRGAIAFLQWIGIQVHCEVSDVYRACKESMKNMPLIDNIEIAALENLLGYSFRHKGLLLQAFIHPSYNKHLGGCYQRLEFLGDAVLEYLITSYLYSVYPDLKPGQLTDLRSITVNNFSFAQTAVLLSLHTYLIEDSNSLIKEINMFESYVHARDSKMDLLEEPTFTYPKVLGDIVESCIGAILLDTGFNLEHVWRIMLNILRPVLSFSSFQLNPVRELRELCQSYDFKLTLPDPVKEKGGHLVTVDVTTKDGHLNFTATNPNSRAARKTAAQEALSKLKALGFKPKNKSLEEIVRSTQKKEPKLIGYDEEPIVVNITDFIQLEKLQLQGNKETPSGLHLHEAEGASSPSSNRDVRESVVHKQPSPPFTSVGRHQVITSAASGSQKGKQELVGGQIPQTSEPSNCNKDEETSGKKSAKSQLIEGCRTNYWSPPSFVCFKEEGLSHLKMFTYKVTVEVEAATATILECYSEPRARKKAAQEHAAEGALWYLRHEGYLSKI